MSVVSEATFTKKVRCTSYPYMIVSIPTDVVKLLGLESGDCVEIHLKLLKRHE